MKRTLVDVPRFEDVVRRSRFVAIAGPVASVDDAMAFLERWSDRSATHNCWAYRVGDQYRFNDDGEPGGTAGRPILGAIDDSGLDDVVVLVIRHYGGTKLGAGGLARAYRGAAARCLAAGRTRKVVPRCRLSIALPFEHLGALHGLVERFGANRLAEEYAADAVRFELELDQCDVDGFIELLEGLTRGTATVRRSATTNA